MLLLALVYSHGIMAEEKNGMDIGAGIFDAMFEEAMNGNVEVMRAVAHMYAIRMDTELRYEFGF